MADWRPPYEKFEFTYSLCGRKICPCRSIAATVFRAADIFDTWVVLPDHMHCVWTLPPDDGDFSSRWQAIKTVFPKAVPMPRGRSA